MSLQPSQSAAKLSMALVSDGQNEREGSKENTRRERRLPLRVGFTVAIVASLLLWGLALGAGLWLLQALS